MSRTTHELLREALVHLDLASEYAARDDVDQVVIDAICMRLSAGIEVLASLDPDILQRLFGTRWPLMWGMRNRIAHGYLLVNADIVRQTIKDDLPEIAGAVGRELDR